MTISPAKSALSGIRKGEPIPEEAMVYIVARAQARAYDFVVSKFFEKEQSDELLRADLARMTRTGPAQITRWLSSPRNWTIETVAKLLLAIDRSEIEFRSVPIDVAAGQTNWGTGWDDHIRFKFADTNEHNGDIDTADQTTESGVVLTITLDAA